MFTLSAPARDIVRQIVEQHGRLNTAGLRIAASSGDVEALRVSTALKPRQGDEVADFGGARVFLDKVARARLRNRVLHVRTRPDGRLEFRSLRQDAVA